MLGKVVEIQDREGLFVVVKEKNYEDMGSCSYERDYWIVPYQPEVDDMEVNLAEAELRKVRSTRLPITVKEDKKPYTQYGTSHIRGVEKVYFERIWEEVIIPGR
jgi:hypothetical protein